jgi:hypothetical protein
MTRLCLTILALAFVIVAVPAAVLAQDAAKPPSMAGTVITRKLAECKMQAKEQKLSYGKRRKFVGACVKG